MSNIIKLNKYEVMAIEELKSYPLIRKQLEEVADLFPDINLAVLKYAGLIDSYKEVLTDDSLYDEEYDDLFMDENFYIVIEYIADFTPDEISELFGYYGGGGIYIDKEGRGAVVIQG